MRPIIKYRVEEKNLKDLKPHPLAEELGLDNEKDLQETFAIYTNETKLLGNYERVFVTADNKIIGNIHTWAALLANGEETRFVHIAEGLHEEEVIRFTNAQSLFFKRSAVGKARLFRAWKRYLTETERGKEYAYTLPGEKTAEKIAAITGYGASTIKMYLSIIDTNESALYQIGEEEGMRTVIDVYNEAQQKKNGQSEEEQDSTVKEGVENKDSEQKKKRKVNLGYEPNDFQVVFDAGIPKLHYKNSFIDLKPVQTTTTKQKITQLFQTEDGETSVEVRIINPLHIINKY